MALSLSNFLYAICGFLSVANAATRTYDFDVGWVTRNPDGMKPRPVIGINGQWPLPRIEAYVGDEVVVNMKNNLGNQSTSIHFHGLYMEGNNHMDGVVGVTQCPVPPGSSFTYKFNVSKRRLFDCRTNWSRSHNQAHTGTTPTLMVNILMGSVALSSSLILRTPLQTTTTKNSFSHSPIGTMTKCQGSSNPSYPSRIPPAPNPSPMPLS